MIEQEQYSDHAAETVIAIRKSLEAEKLLHLRAQVLKVSVEEAAVREWPEGMVVEEMP